MKRVTVTLGDEDAFFACGKTIAALADAGKPIPNEWIISFGDPADLERVVTPIASDFVRAAVARMQSAPRFVSVAEAASYASYELNGGPVVSGDSEGRVPENLVDDGNE